jgi:phage gp36-like protein
MAYCTLDDIKEVLPEAMLIDLTDDRTPSQAIVQSVVDAAIGTAGETMNGFLRGRYTLPLPSEGIGLLKSIAVSLAVFELYCRRPDDSKELPDHIQKKWTNANKLLELIQKGTVTLGIEQGVTEPGEFKCNKTSSDRMFPKSVLDMY